MFGSNHIFMTENALWNWNVPIKSFCNLILLVVLCTIIKFLFLILPNVRGFSPNFVSMSPYDNFSGNSDVPRSLSTLLAQARSMLTIRVHIFASRPSDDCSDVPVGSF